MNKILVATFLCISLSLPHVSAQTSVLQRIAKANKQELVEQDKVVQDSLVFIEQQLVKLKQDVQRTQTTSEKIADWGTRISLAVALVGAGVTAGGFVYDKSGALPFIAMAGTSISVYVANAFSLLDLLAVKEVSPDEFNKNYDEMLSSLKNLRDQSTQEQKNQLTTVIAEFEEAKSVVDQETRNERIKDAVQVTALVIGGASLYAHYFSPYVQKMDASISIPLVVGGALVSGASLSYATFSGENKNEIIQTIDECLEQIQSAKELLN